MSPHSNISEIEQTIEHLDFDVEKKKPLHFQHPIEPDVYWCGEKRPEPAKPGVGRINRSIKDITCVGCLHLYIEKGGAWWWRVNRAWYGT